MAQPIDMFLLFLRALNRLAIEYMVTGSAASMAYGEPRMTLDVDLVVDLPAARVGELFHAFPAPEFYCPSEQVLQLEVRRQTRGHFNVIHIPTGFKADFYPVGADIMHAWAMRNRRTVLLAGEKVLLAPPEYVIVRKLQYFREGGSQKHLRDIAGMLRLAGADSGPIDQAMVNEWVERLGLTTEWQQAQGNHG